MKILIVFMMSVSSTFALAAETCENYAKYFSIKDYKQRVGTIQGSDGIQYDAELISISDDEHTFQVQIHDNNEDGEYWTVVYEVTVKETPNSKICTLIHLEATDLED